jgi:anti-sigma regulatory factor (Ser/Thr protein kinase)
MIRRRRSREPEDNAVQAQLPASLLAPRQARATVRRALSARNLETLINDAELLASELAANAAEHADGTAIGLSISTHTEPGGRHVVTCEVTDASPALPLIHSIQPDSERGRGWQIIGAVAASSGITGNKISKTAWFSLSTSPDPASYAHRDEQEAQHDAEWQASYETEHQAEAEM